MITINNIDYILIERETSAPCSKCSFFNNTILDCKFPENYIKECKCELTGKSGWKTKEYQKTFK